MKCSPDDIPRVAATAAGRDLRIEGRHAVLLTSDGQRLSISVCGLCSALIATDNDGELRHLLFHDATDTIDPSHPAPSPSPRR